MFRVPVGRYTLLTLAGSLIWCAVFAGIGWAVGSRWESVHHALRYVDYAVVAAAAVIVVMRGGPLAPGAGRNRWTDRDGRYAWPGGAAFATPPGGVVARRPPPRAGSGRAW